MSGRTTKLRLIDGTTVTVPEPAWCVSEHQDGEYPADIVHEGPEVALVVSTNLEDVTLLDAGLTQYPYSENLGDRGVKAAVLVGGGWYRFDPDGLYALADGLNRHAMTLRALARQLAELRSAGPAL